MDSPQLQELAPGIWIVENEVRTLGLSFVGKMTVLRGSGDQLLLYSPVPIDDTLKAQLDALGQVTDIVAPNAFHHLFAKKTYEQFPDASLHLSCALENKRADLGQQGRTLKSGESLELHGGDITALAIAGMPKIEEIVIFHRPTQSLLAADLLMNVHNAAGLMTQLMMRLEGVWQQLAVPRLFRLLVKERPALRESVAQLQAWPVERIVPCHGDTVVQGSTAHLQRCFAWV